MAEFDFTLILQGVDVGNAATLDSLFEAGCDDATFGEVDGVAFADFTRRADSLAAGIEGAIRDVRRGAPGAEILRVEPDDLVTAADIAHRLGRTRESVRLLISGARGQGGFPPPVSHLKARGRLWRWAEVSAWCREALGTTAPAADTSVFVAALNDALELSKLAPRLQEKSERDLIGGVLRDSGILEGAAERTSSSSP